MTLVVTGLLLSSAADLPAAADTVEFTIGDTRITESSGLATDADNQRYWTINDSGDAGIAYALDADGKTTGTLRFRVNPVDVEAVAFHDGRLYVADIGDNRERRQLITVYFFEDAQPTDQPVVYKAYDFSYPDGPHDAETLLVDSDGRLYIVTKGAKAGIYAAPESPARQGVNQLERLGDAPPYVTDGTVLSDGRFVLRTYVSVETVDAKSFKVTARAATPAQKQGESITTSFDGDALLIGSEGRRSKVLRIGVPTDLGEAPSPTSDPSTAAPATRSPTPSSTKKGEKSASPSPVSSAASDDEVPDVEPSSTSRAGTFAALGLAGLVAAVAGAVVVLVRRP